MHALTPGPKGNWGCTLNTDLYTPFGCIAALVSTRAECESMQGYWWQETPTNVSGMYH